MNKILIAILITFFLIPSASAAPDFFTADNGNISESPQGFIPFADGTHYAVSAKHGISTMGTQTLPHAFDWRTEGIVSNAKAQLTCGGCYGFASVSSLESIIALNTGILHDLSENQAIKQNWQGLNLDDVGGCNGGNAEMVMNLWTQYGTMLEIDDPFTVGDMYNPNATPIYRVNDWKLISTDKTPSRNVLKQYIMKYGPLYSTLNGTQLAMEDVDYDGSYTITSSTETQSTDHAVVIIGWDDVKYAWIIKNSWDEWGEEGFGYVDYDSFGLGFYTSVVSGFEPYDINKTVHALDEGGYNGALGALGFDHIQGLTIHKIENENIKVVEFWTTGETSDVDITIYDGFVNKNFGNKLYEIKDLYFTEPGYQSVNVGNVTSDTGTAILVINLLNLDCVNFDDKIAPIAIDMVGPGSKSRSFVSIGDETHKWYNVWYDTTNLKMADGERHSLDIGHRLITSPVDSVPVTKSEPQPEPQADYVTNDELQSRVNNIIQQLNEYDNESTISYEQILNMLDAPIDNGGIINKLPNDYITVDEFDEMMTSIEERISEIRENSKSWIQKIVDKIKDILN